MDPRETNAETQSDQAGTVEAAADTTLETGADAGPEVVSDPTLEWKNRVAYLSAEIENMRKRFMREKSEVIRFANESLLKSILPVMDNLQFAFQAATKKGPEKEGVEESAHMQALLKGLEMTIKHFEQNLEQLGVQGIPSVGTAFDPAIHEAMGQASDASIAADFVVAEVQRGYTLNGRVLRPAKVLVNKIQN